jgi:hypothetical protein
MQTKACLLPVPGPRIVSGEGTATDKREITRRKEKGPFHYLCRCQCLYEGLPEHVAKVLCFAILKMAAG